MYNEYRRLSSYRQLKLFYFILRAYFWDNSKLWFELWDYHVVSMGLKRTAIEPKKKTIYWYCELFNLEYFYYRQIIIRAEKFNDFYLYFLASFISGEHNDRCYALRQMVRLANSRLEWVLIWRLSYPLGELNRSAEKKILELN